VRKVNKLNQRLRLKIGEETLFLVKHKYRRTWNVYRNRIFVSVCERKMTDDGNWDKTYTTYNFPWSFQSYSHLIVIQCQYEKLGLQSRISRKKPCWSQMAISFESSSKIVCTFNPPYSSSTNLATTQLGNLFSWRLSFFQQSIIGIELFVIRYNLKRGLVKNNVSNYLFNSWYVLNHTERIKRQF